MFGLSHLFYPWGFIVQIFAIVHFVRRRPENYWFFVIFFGGFLGAGVYIVAEVLPDLGLLRGVFQGFGRRSRIQIVETQILDNPSAANYEELGELYKDQKQFAKAREAFTNAITARSDSVYTFYYRAQASLGMGDFAAAIPDLERVVASDRKFDYYRAAGLLADAYAQTGQLERAESTLRRRGAILDDYRNALQLCVFSEACRPPRGSTRVGAEAAHEEADTAALHAAI